MSYDDLFYLCYAEISWDFLAVLLREQEASTVKDAVHEF